MTVTRVVYIRGSIFDPASGTTYPAYDVQDQAGLLGQVFKQGEWWRVVGEEGRFPTRARATRHLEAVHRAARASTPEG